MKRVNINQKEKEIYIIAGHNGSGKSSFAREFLAEKNIPFINADDISKEISPHPENVKITAGKIFFKKLKEFSKSNLSFAIESTLSGKYLVPYIKKWNQLDFKVHIIFLFLDSPETAIQRIKLRVLKGGHHIPDHDVIRRYSRSIFNFWYLYRNIVSDWELYFNGKDELVQIAFGKNNEYIILNEFLFEQFRSKFNEKENL